MEVENIEPTAATSRGFGFTPSFLAIEAYLFIESGICCAFSVNKWYAALSCVPGSVSSDSFRAPTAGSPIQLANALQRKHSSFVRSQNA